MLWMVGVLLGIGLGQTLALQASSPYLEILLFLPAPVGIFALALTGRATRTASPAALALATLVFAFHVAVQDGHKENSAALVALVAGVVFVLWESLLAVPAFMAGDFLRRVRLSGS